MTRDERTTVASLVTVLVALLLVGLVSGTLVRHLVQVVPVALSALVVSRRAWGRFAAMAVLGFWLFIMALIWLYLLGLARIVTGSFSTAEVVLTVLIGLAALVGIRTAARLPTRPAWPQRLAAFGLGGALQAAAMWMSLQPAFAGD